jgi:hypothetical protein
VLGRNDSNSCFPTLIKCRPCSDSEPVSDLLGEMLARDMQCYRGAAFSTAHISV